MRPEAFRQRCGVLRPQRGAQERTARAFRPIKRPEGPLAFSPLGIYCGPLAHLCPPEGAKAALWRLFLRSPFGFQTKKRFVRLSALWAYIAARRHISVPPKGRKLFLFVGFSVPRCRRGPKGPKGPRCLWGRRALWAYIVVPLLSCAPLWAFREKSRFALSLRRLRSVPFGDGEPFGHI